MQKGEIEGKKNAVKGQNGEREREESMHHRAREKEIVMCLCGGA